MLSTEQIAEAVSELSSHYHVVDSNDAARALGAEIEALVASTMIKLSGEHRRANQNFGRAIEDLVNLLG